MGTLSTAARNAAIAAVGAQVDAGSGAGKLRIRAGLTTLVDIALADPAFGSSAPGVITAASLPRSGTPVATGVADNAQLLDSDNNPAETALTVGTSGTEVILDSTSIVTGLVILITGFTLTQPAS